jgi:hypothetical protein
VGWIINIFVYLLSFVLWILLMYNAYQGTANGEFDGFISKISPDGSSLVFSTYLGGEYRDYIFDLDANSTGVIVTGSASEEELARTVVRYSSGSAVSVAGRFSLKPLAALLAHARLVVSNSTGPLHIAAAVGTPVIAFFPPEMAFNMYVAVSFRRDFVKKNFEQEGN